MPYAMCPAPVPVHQRASLVLSRRFDEALEKCKQCTAYPPLDWKIEEDTVVQPDLLIVSGKIEKKFLDFPPPLVVEILSASTASKDRNEKMELYQSQKVKYYLIVDPQFKKVEIYEYLEQRYELVSENPETYAFQLQPNCTANVNLLEIWE